LTKARVGHVWEVLRDIGALHTRLVPGFVTDTKLERGECIVTFRNGMVVREPIVDIDDIQPWITKPKNVRRKWEVKRCREQ